MNQWRTDMNAVRSIAISGIISISCSEAMSSSSGGVTEVLRDIGRDIVAVKVRVTRWCTCGSLSRSTDFSSFQITDCFHKMTTATTSAEPACKHLVLDAGPLLSFSPLRNLSQTYYVVPQVISELKDSRAKAHFESLALNAGVRIQVRDPSSSSLAHGAYNPSSDSCDWSNSQKSLLLRRRLAIIAYSATPI